MPQMQLTELAVRALKGSASPTYYWDTFTPGFGVRVGKRSKTWTVIRGRNRERLTIGKFGDLSLTDARKEAKRLLSAEPDAKVATKTFKEARDAFLATYSNERTQYQVKRSLERHYKPLEGSWLPDITAEAIERCLTRIQAPSARLHAFRYLRAMLRWCQRLPRRWIEHSPLEGYEVPGTDKRGTRTLSDDELTRVWHASPSIFRLMILWGTRNTETCALEREWIVDGVCTIPGTHTKNGRDHAIPICPLAEHLLSGTSNQYVFPGRWDGHISPGALGKLKREVMAKSGTSGWQLRDIRRTFRSNMARLKVPREVAEVLINHAPPVLDDIYDRYDRIEEKHEALARYERSLVLLLARV